MKIQGVSLGWNCTGAYEGTNLGLRDLAASGYLTCPFDAMNNNYIGLCKCLEDDFAHFCDPKYLEMRKAPYVDDLIRNQNKDELWIYNSYYGFAFNHESPGHGGLYLGEKWVGGINHFVDNNFENFIKRYERRINNFRNYLETHDFINFIIWRYNRIPYEIVDIIKNKYPNLKFKVHAIVNYGRSTPNSLMSYTPGNYFGFEQRYLEYLGVDPKTNPEEYERYSIPFTFQDNQEINEHIVLIDLMKR